MLRRVRASWPFDALDLLGLVGLLILAYGCSLLHPALPWVVIGLGLMIAAWFAAHPPRSVT